ncbi:neurofascin-like [Mya arenaria]|uniref:neurofascin-like n=1 Tax=Mya arenaria TaxID=6604 RepID=UPI0022E6AEF0|nr:neurofascin-like [Mya arenaria]
MLRQVWILAVLWMSVDAAGKPPKIIKPQGNHWNLPIQYVRQGDPKTVECSAEGSQPITYKWTFNGENIKSGSTSVAFSPQTGNLMVGTLFGNADSGDYQCIATNSYGTTMTPYVKLILAVSGNLFPGDQTQFPDNVEVFASNHYAMKCVNQPFSIPPLEISWEMGKLVNNEYKKEKDVMENERIVIDPTGTLHFLWSEPSDNNLYRCAGKNTISESTVQNTKILNLVVKTSSSKDRAPELKFNKDVVVKAGETARLTCIFSYYSSRGEKLTIEWRFSNEKVGEGRTIKLTNVKVPDDKQTQEGEYLCEAHLGELQPVQGKVNLKITAPPKFDELRKPSHTSAPVDSSPNYYCSTTSHNSYSRPPVWFVNGKPLIGCPPYTFDCGVPALDGFSQCVPEKQVCDSSPDCSNDADERNCPASCGEGQKVCNGACISFIDDCIPAPANVCEYPNFECANGKGCLPKAQKCDGPTQCQDKSDELGCPGRQNTKHDRIIVNSDRSVLTIPNVQKEDVMCFQCLVSNNYGTVPGDGCLTVIEKIRITTPPNETYSTKPDSVVSVYVDAITDSAWINQLGYTWFWYKPVTFPNGSKGIEQQMLPPPGLEKYFTVSSSKKNMTMTVPDVTQPVDPKNTAMYDLYNLLTEYRMFMVNVSHKYDSVAVKFTVVGETLKEPVEEPAVEKAAFNWWIIILIVGILILFIILGLIICYCYRNRGGTYLLDKKEKKAGNDPEQELKDSGFQDAGRVDDYYDSTRPMEEKASLTGSNKPYDSDEDAAEEYGGESDVNKFNEDGSFIGEYNKRNDLPNTKEATV